MNEKRGQELSIGTLILIVLGIIVLVLLVLGFSIGWDNLFSKFRITSGSDLSAMVASCKVAVATDSTIDFCQKKKVRVDGKPEEINCLDDRVLRELGGSKLTCPA